MEASTGLGFIQTEAIKVRRHLNTKGYSALKSGELLSLYLGLSLILGLSLSLLQLPAGVFVLIPCLCPDLRSKAWLVAIW